MPASTLKRKSFEPVIQFSVFADNKVGRLSEWVVRLANAQLHIMALSVLDSTECTIIRFIPDYPESARELLQSAAYAFTETDILAVEMESEADLKFITSALVEAEVNIHYLYPFLVRPRNRCALALSVEDNDFARTVLSARGIRCLDRHDIAR